MSGLLVRIKELNDKIKTLEDRNRIMLSALELVASLPGFEETEPYGKIVQCAIRAQR